MDPLSALAREIGCLAVHATATWQDGTYQLIAGMTGSLDAPSWSATATYEHKDPSRCFKSRGTGDTLLQVVNHVQQVPATAWKSLATFKHPNPAMRGARAFYRLAGSGDTLHAAIGSAVRIHVKPA